MYKASYVDTVMNQLIEQQTFCSVVSLVRKGIQSCLFSKWLLYYLYIYIYTSSISDTKKYIFLKNILLHSLLFNQLIHNCVKVPRKLYTYMFQQTLHRQQALELPKIYQGNSFKKGLRTCCIIHTSACLL